MNFILLDDICEIFHSEGSWKPQFVHRTKKETNPFLLDPTIEGHNIILHRPFSKKVLQEIIDHLKYTLPKHAKIIFCDKKNINYYLLLKPNAYPSKLSHLTVFHRHANRLPILRFPVFELELKRIEYNPQADLTELGFQKSKEFAKDLARIYNLDRSYKYSLHSSPIKRCQDTLSTIKNTLNLFEEIEIDNDLMFSISADQKKNLELEKCANVIEILEQRLKLKSIDVRQIPDIYSSLICYAEMGKTILTPFEMEIVRVATDYVMNYIFDNVLHHYNGLIERLMKKYVQFNNSLYDIKLCSTHDTLVFLLSKSFTKKPLEYSKYLSNVRFESWTDGEVRVYYDNICL